MAIGDPSFKDDLKKDGYSKEEKYFYDISRELIDAKLEARRASNVTPLRVVPSAPPPDESLETTPPQRGLVHWLKKIFGAREGSTDLF
jgi:hypothetical protein